MCESMSDSENMCMCMYVRECFSLTVFVFVSGRDKLCAMFEERVETNSGDNSHIKFEQKRRVNINNSALKIK